jgi:hypothetical protein
MLELEEEIQKPTGIWTIDPPKLSVNGLLISKECGLMYEVTETDGLRQIVFHKLRHLHRTQYSEPAGHGPFSAKLPPVGVSASLIPHF